MLHVHYIFLKMIELHVFKGTPGAGNIAVYLSSIIGN
jgi:hypothetical protein